MFHILLLSQIKFLEFCEFRITAGSISFENLHSEDLLLQSKFSLRWKIFFPKVLENMEYIFTGKGKNSLSFILVFRDTHF